jgi:hypothetical protein
MSKNQRSQSLAPHSMKKIEDDIITAVAELGTNKKAMNQ